MMKEKELICSNVSEVSLADAIDAVAANIYFNSGSSPASTVVINR